MQRLCSQWARISQSKSPVIPAPMLQMAWTTSLMSQPPSGRRCGQRKIKKRLPLQLLRRRALASLACSQVGEVRLRNSSQTRLRSLALIFTAQVRASGWRQSVVLPTKSSTHSRTCQPSLLRRNSGELLPGPPRAQIWLCMGQRHREALHGKRCRMWSPPRRKSLRPSRQRREDTPANFASSKESLAAMDTDSSIVPRCGPVLGTTCICMPSRCADVKWVKR